MKTQEWPLVGNISNELSFDYKNHIWNQIVTLNLNSDVNLVRSMDDLIILGLKSSLEHYNLTFDPYDALNSVF